MAKKKVRRKAVIPANESKSERFVRVVQPRVAKAVKAINQVGLCSASSYEYTPQQLQQITKALNKALDDMLAKYAGKSAGQAGFEFKS